MNKYEYTLEAEEYAIHNFVNTLNKEAIFAVKNPAKDKSVLVATDKLDELSNHAAEMGIVIKGMKYLSSAVDVVLTVYSKGDESAKKELFFSTEPEVSINDEQGIADITGIRYTENRVSFVHRRIDLTREYFKVDVNLM